LIKIRVQVIFVLNVIVASKIMNDKRFFRHIGKII